MSQTDIIIKTSLGTIHARLDGKKAPVTVANFLSYVGDEFFDGTVFHRVIAGFMIQGGGMTADLERKPTKPAIAIESQNGLTNTRGTLAMARTSDPNSATAQFFINVQDNPSLDFRSGRGGEGYTVFGAVTAGMDVVDAIRRVETTTKAGHQNVPVEAVIIESIRTAQAV